MSQPQSDHAPTSPATDPSNLSSIKPKIAAAANKIIKLKAKRAEINESINAERSALVELGVNRHAFNRALADFELENASKRREQDISYEIVREALDIQLALDFDPASGNTE